MIGVIASTCDQDVVREFFELFKTPWEFSRSGRKYDVLLCAGDHNCDASAALIVHYAAKRIAIDDQLDGPVAVRPACNRILERAGIRLPIYGESAIFPNQSDCLLTDEHSGECVAYAADCNIKSIVRIGYDLFHEVRNLLTQGQPLQNAALPALELHIAFLRNLITGSGLTLVEIPPTPDGHSFTACLTHDVDHPSIRRHKLDHTTIGFLYRATLGSVLAFVRGRLSIRGLIANWAAALKLPLVHLGMADDFWCQFDEDYLTLERGRPSTFFVIPFKDRAGRSSQGTAPAFRASRYGARDIIDAIQTILRAGCEVGLHGIDAWLDLFGAHEEMNELRRVSGLTDLGVRMHWLYYDRQSPAALDRAGALYDSTIGYNETVGYRAGTTQVYKPLEAACLLELPLHIMDTALFYPTRLELSGKEAANILALMINNALQFGGCLTINWHDRSLAPERWWGGVYKGLIRDLTHAGAWFATARQAVSWFRKRRAAVIEADRIQCGAVRVTLKACEGNASPRLRLRIHNASEWQGVPAEGHGKYVDIPFDQTIEIGALTRA